MSSNRRGRGLAAETLDIIDEMIEIAEAIQPCSVRALAYQLFIRGLIPSMETTQTSRVSNISVTARERGMLPWGWIVDKTRQEQGVPTWDDLEAYGATVRDLYRKNNWADQPTVVYVWSEKDTIEGTLQPVLKRHAVSFQVFHGWSGATPVRDAAQANLYRKQDTLILYVGDYDPSGMGMSELDLPRRLARYSSDDPAKKKVSQEWVRATLEALHLQVRRIALTTEDTVALGRDLGFPAADKGPKPGSKGDSRYPWFVENYGDWCWELDALAPNILRERVESAILSAIDRETWDRCLLIEQADKDFLEHLTDTRGSNSGPVEK
jgi:hypothetical protein